MFKRNPFNTIKKDASPRKKFKQELLVQCQQEFMPIQQKTMFRFAASSTIALVVVFGLGTGVFAYESPSVTEGHPLNFVKENVEKVEERFARTPEARAKFHAKMSGRRLKEANRHKGNEDHRQRLLQVASEELDLSLEEIKERLKDEDTRKEIMEQLKESHLKHAPLYDHNKKRDGEEVRDNRPKPPKGIGPEVAEFRQDLKAQDLSPEEMHEAMKAHMDQLLEKRLEKIKEENPEKYDEAVERVEKHKERRQRQRERIQDRREDRRNEQQFPQQNQS